MKTSKILMLAATCGYAVSPIGAIAAFADTVPLPTAATASSATLAAMQDQCDALAMARDTGNGDIWSGDVVAGAVTLVSGPTESGPRDIDEGTIAHAGTYVPGNTEIRGDPFRIGGSVNMFGDQWSTAGYWTDSTYSFTADYDSTFSHAFTCDISQEVFHEGQYHPATPVQGFYINCDFGNGQGNDNSGACTVENAGQPQGSCEAANMQGPSFNRWGEDTEQCKFIMTEPAHDEYTDPDTWDAPLLISNEPGIAVEQDQTDSIYAFEDHGGPVQVTGEYHIGQAVICISPSKTVKGGVPGAWANHNGYTGDKCTTDWFKVAPWGAGTEGSNGTYISVPNYSF